MKWIALLGLLLSSLALQAQTTVQVPVIPTNGTFAAFWYSPSYIPRTNSNLFVQPIANIWVPEMSTDGEVWILCQSQCANLPLRAVRALNQPCLNCLHFAEVPNATYLVRIRLAAY